MIAGAIIGAVFTLAVTVVVALRDPLYTRPIVLLFMGGIGALVGSLQGAVIRYFFGR